MPFGLFFLSTSFQLALVLGLYAWIAGPTLAAEASNLPLLVAWILVLGVPLSLFEYLYHRYLLHSAVLPFLGIMHHCHAEHHGLTSVKAPVLSKEPERMVPVASEYPVEHEHQEASMMFPYFAASIFYAIFVGMAAIPLKLLIQSQPLVLAMIVTVTLYYAGYEVWHAILHLPYERFWGPLVQSRGFGGVTRYIYSFHLVHHCRPTSNLAVVGLWGVAVWDHLFATHKRPKHLPLDGASINYRDISLPKPRWPISFLDRLQGPFYRGSRTIERTLSKAFRKR